MLKETRRQAIGTVIGAAAAAAALLVSAVALIISAQAWSIQRKLNAQQVQLNTYAATRELQVYSSQVSIWARPGTTFSSDVPVGLDVWVQNRAPVPIHDARVIARLGSGVDAEVSIGDLAPCTRQTFRMAPPEGQSFIHRPEQWLGYTDLKLTFVETSRIWMLTRDSLTMVPTSPARAIQLPQLAYHEATIDGCGAGG